MATVVRIKGIRQRMLVASVVVALFSEFVI